MLESIGLSGAHELGLFMAAVLVFNATPGVDVLLTVTRTLQGGVRAGAAAALGINVGCAVHALAAAFGLAALLAVSATAFAAIKWVGAAYLLWLAWGMLRAARHGALAAAPAPAAAPRSAWADFRIGLLTNLFNPKAALFILAFVPQFIGPGAANKNLAFAALAAMMIVQGMVYLLGVVAVASRLRTLPRSPRAARWLNATGSLMFALLALRLVAARQPAA